MKQTNFFELVPSDKFDTFLKKIEHWNQRKFGFNEQPLDSK